MTTQTTPKYNSVLVIDDHKMIVNGIKLLIGDLFESFYMAYDGATAKSLALIHNPQMIIVDNYLPDTAGDILVRELKYKLPTVIILVYSFTYSADVILKMLKAGANGYVIKKDDDEEFVKAVHLLLNNKEYYSPEARTHIINQFSGTEDDYSVKHLIANTKFSGKEIEMIKLLCKQMNTKEISKNINLSERTVEQYRSNITRRIGAKNLAGVIKFALQNGIVRLDDL
jgi:DNA-binding NarL/FixJ family response regulator